MCVPWPGDGVSGCRQVGGGYPPGQQYGGLKSACPEPCPDLLPLLSPSQVQAAPSQPTQDDLPPIYNLVSNTNV